MPDEDLPGLMAGCKAFLFPGLEDFGITPVQAQASGRPVIAFAGGGALDTVIPGRTGELFAEQAIESLVDVLRHFDADKYDSDVLQSDARQYDTSVFRHELGQFVTDSWNLHRTGTYNLPKPNHAP